MANDVPPLVNATALADFPGAPFKASLVEAAAESVRTDAGWHIAPSITSTARVRPRGGALFLRTLYLTEVSQIRDVSDPSDPKDVDLAEWDWTPGGVVEPVQWWRRQARVYEVTFVHGYDKCPADLIPAVAFRVQRSTVNAAAGSVRLGSLSVNPSGTPNTSIAEASQPDAVVGHYRIPRSR